MASAETQNSGQSTSGESGFYSPSGGGSGSGGSVGGGTVTAEESAQEVVPIPPPSLTLSEQIAANFAALSGLLGNTDQTGGGSYPVPVPVSSSAKQSSPLIWVVMVGAAVAVWYFFFRKKGNENG